MANSSTKIRERAMLVMPAVTNAPIPPSAPNAKTAKAG